MLECAHCIPASRLPLRISSPSWRFAEDDGRPRRGITISIPSKSRSLSVTTTQPLVSARVRWGASWRAMGARRVTHCSRSATVLPMTEEELQKTLDDFLVASERHDVFVEEFDGQDVRLRFSLAPGERWTSAALLSLVDTSLRAAAGVDQLLSHLAVTVLRPAQDADVIALSRVIRRDGGVAHAEAWLFSHAVVDPMIHATSSFASPWPG